MNDGPKTVYDWQVGERYKVGEMVFYGENLDICIVVESGLLGKENEKADKETEQVF
jgi:hypothetical protein